MPENRRETTSDSDEDTVIHSFVVRAWLEETSAEKRLRVWRGHITHIPGGEQHYFTSVQEIVPFIESYLKGQE